jgi:hypothetical protein
MRKRWIATIDYPLYSRLHQAVLQRLGVDIDSLPEHALNDLKKFYMEGLSMNYHNIYFHLPQLKNIPINLEAGKRIRQESEETTISTKPTKNFKTSNKASIPSKKTY